MPAYAYYLLIKAANDRSIEQNLQSLFFAVTAITPFDEFFLIGKALKYSYKGLKSVNYAKARNLLSIKPCVLKPKYKKLFAGHTEKLKKYVKFGEDVANTTSVLKLIDRLDDYKGIRNKLESFNDNALKSKFLNDFAESGDEIWKKLDANDGKLLDSWNMLYKSNSEVLVKNDIEILEVISNYLTNSGKEVNNLIYEIKKIGGYKKWKKSIEELIDFTEIDIFGAINHVKYRDLRVPRKRGIGGCHDASEWNKLRTAYYSEGYSVPINKTLNDPDVPEIIIRKKTDHSDVPGIFIVDYSMPTINGKLSNPITKETLGFTTGTIKDIRNPKTLYDPNIWTDKKLEKALQEAIIDAYINNGKILPREWIGKTKEGYSLRGYYENGKITSFFFQ